MIFRYPGGKNKLLRILDPFIEKALEGKKSFHDVFAGGGSVLLHVARKHPKISLHANDADDHIAVQRRINLWSGERAKAWSDGANERSGAWGQERVGVVGSWRTGWGEALGFGPGDVKRLVRGGGAEIIRGG